MKRLKRLVASSVVFNAEKLSQKLSQVSEKLFCKVESKLSQDFLEVLEIGRFSQTYPSKSQETNFG